MKKNQKKNESEYKRYILLEDYQGETKDITIREGHNCEENSRTLNFEYIQIFLSIS